MIPVDEVYSALETVKDSECSCSMCVEMCKHQICWGTPHEIQRLIELGYMNRLMRDYWVGNFVEPEPEFLSKDYYDVHIICPAEIGEEGGFASSWHGKPCTFLTPDNKCEIHVQKPTEGRKAICRETNIPFRVHEYVARTWDTPEGRKIVEQFMRTNHEGDD